MCVDKKNISFCSEAKDLIDILLFIFCEKRQEMFKKIIVRMSNKIVEIINLINDRSLKSTDQWSVIKQ
jgi:hypothetical protein